jgi:thioredoxin reductase
MTSPWSGPAGQATLHLAGYAAQVTMLVRGPTLAETMSDYLVRELKATANVTVRYNGDVRHGSTERVAGAVGDGSVAIRLVHEYLSHQG